MKLEICNYFNPKTTQIESSLFLDGVQTFGTTPPIGYQGFKYNIASICFTKESLVTFIKDLTTKLDRIEQLKERE